MMDPCGFCDARCCRNHVITVTSFDIVRIISKTKMKFEDFASLEPLKILNYDEDTVLECYEKGLRYDYVLALKSHPCTFLKGNRCTIHHFSPLVCRCYPFNSIGKILKRKQCSITSDVLFRLNGPSQTEEYSTQIKKYKELVRKWNRKKGTVNQCIKFLMKFKP
ncbi:YkgJ family cysteine cluster protein [Candidatus Micrarchaeota archaeon]|nr:YkgJ family cysteine cluster protein [Candidatus Micrarchaeota archaeon]